MTHLRARILAVILVIVAVSTGLSLGFSTPAYAKTNTVLLSGSDWMGGAGVDVYSNDGSYDSADGDINSVNIGTPEKPKNITTGFRWQCVELINRLYLLRGWTSAYWSGNGKDMYGSAPATLGKSPDGKIATVSPGDVIVQDGGWGDYGHVSIVDSVDGTTIKTVNQNIGSTTESVRKSFTWDKTKKTIKPWTNYSMIGVVHAPVDGSAQLSTAPQIFQVKRTADPSGVRQVYAATNTAVAEAWWVPGGNGVHLHEVINISQQNIVGFDKVNLPGGTQAVYTAVSDGVWESWWKPDGTRGAEKIVTELSGVKGVFAYNTTENGQFVHHLYILASDGPYEAWWKDGGDGVHLSRLTNINGGTTFTMSVAPGGQMQLYVATPTWVYEVWWVPGSNDVHVGTIINVTQGDIRAVAKAANLADGTQRLYTTTSTTVWQSVWGAGRPNIQTTAKVVSQTNAVMSEHMVTGSANQLYVATGNRVQEYWWTSNNSGGGTLTDIAQGNIGAIDKHNDGSTQQLYTGAGAWVYETWWGGGASPSTTGLFQVAH